MHNKTNKNVNVLEYLLFLLTFFLIYGPRLGFNIPVINDVIVLTSLVGIFYLISVVLKEKKIQLIFINMFVLLVIITLYSFIIVWVNGFKDTFIFLRNGRALFSYWGIVGISIMYLKKYKGKSTYKIIEHIFLSGFLHAIIMWAMLFSDEFRTFIHNVIMYKGYENEIMNIVRVSGLMNVGGDGVSLLQGMISLIAPFVIINVEGKKKIIYFLAFLLTWASSFLSARVGFYLSTAMLFIILLSFTKVPKITFSVKKEYIYIFISVILLVVVLIVAFPENVQKYLFDYYESPIYRLLEPLRAYSRYGEFSTRSSEAILGRMLFVPKEEAVFLFGNSNMGRSNNLEYIHSDVGYVRILFAIGLIGSFLLYSWFVISGLIVFFNNYISNRIKFLVLILIVYMLVGHLKMVFALSRSSFSAFFLIFAITVLNKGKSNNQLSKDLL